MRTARSMANERYPCRTCALALRPLARAHGVCGMVGEGGVAVSTRPEFGVLLKYIYRSYLMASEDDLRQPPTVTQREPADDDQPTTCWDCAGSGYVTRTVIPLIRGTCSSCGGSGVK